MLRGPNDARNEAENEPMIGCAQLSLRLGKLGRVDEHGCVQPDDLDMEARFVIDNKKHADLLFMNMSLQKIHMP